MLRLKQQYSVFKRNVNNKLPEFQIYRTLCRDIQLNVPTVKRLTRRIKVYLTRLKSAKYYFTPKTLRIKQ
jgi:hypothetical protein